MTCCILLMPLGHIFWRPLSTYWMTPPVGRTNLFQPTFLASITFTLHRRHDTPNNQQPAISLVLCNGNPSVTGEFSSQNASSAKFWCFITLVCKFLNSRVADDLRHYDSYVTSLKFLLNDDLKCKYQVTPFLSEMETFCTGLWPVRAFRRKWPEPSDHRLVWVPGWPHEQAEQTATDRHDDCNLGWIHHEICWWGS